MPHKKRKRITDNDIAQNVIQLYEPSAVALSGYNAPHSQEAEEATLGAILMNPAAYDNVASIIRPEDFYFLRNGWIFHAMSLLAEDNIPIDPLTVSDKLNAHNQLSDIGGSAYLLNLINKTPTSVYAEVYARLIFATAIRRRGLEALQHAGQQYMDETISVTEAMDAVQSLIDDAHNEMIDPNQTHISNALQAYMDKLDIQMLTGEATGIPSGFNQFDNYTGGFHREEVVYLTGVEGMGKTQLLLDIILNQASMGLCVLFFSLEMSQEQVIRRLISMYTGISIDRLKSAKIDLSELERLAEAHKRLEEMNIHIIDKYSPLSPLQLQRELRRMKRHMKIDMVCIDGLWLMRDDDLPNGAVGWQEYQGIPRKLATIVKEFNTRMLVIHQYNSNLTSRNDTASYPRLSDMAGGKPVQQNAHEVWGMWRGNHNSIQADCDYPDRTELHRLKARDSQNQNVKVYLQFNKGTSRFSGWKKL